MYKLVTLSVLVLVIAGCNSNSTNISDKKQQAINCANNWKARGYRFDPNSMTCRQMYQRVQAIRRMQFWNEGGYTFNIDPMTLDEIDKKVKDIDRARYWKEKGYNFDPNSMTALEMDQKGEELDDIEFWEKTGYYYDPNSKTVFLDNTKKTELSALLDLQSGGGGWRASAFSYPTLRLSTPHIRNSGKTFDTFRYLQGAPLSFPKLPHLQPGLSKSSPTLGEKTKRGIYLGQWNANEFDPDSTSNPFGAGNQFRPYSIHNKFGKYGSEFSPYSVHNPFATEAPKLYDSRGNYKGRLSGNSFDPDSVSNPFGPYGNRFSLDSVNNPFSLDSPTNPFGDGLSIFGQE